MKNEAKSNRKEPRKRSLRAPFQINIENLRSFKHCPVFYSSNSEIVNNRDTILLCGTSPLIISPLIKLPIFHRNSLGINCLANQI